MEFPRHLHQPNGRYVICPDEAAYEQLTALGWVLLPEGHVENPVEVRLYDALREEKAAEVEPVDAPSYGITDLSADDAKDVIASASAEDLEAIEAEESAGKKRKGVLAAIEVRRADLIDG